MLSRDKLSERSACIIWEKENRVDTEEEGKMNLDNRPSLWFFPGHMPPLCPFLSAHAVKIPNGIATGDDDKSHTVSGDSCWYYYKQ